MNNLGVNNQRRTEPSCFLHDARITFGPVVSVHREQSHPPIAHMDLQPIAVMLMRPPRTGRRFLCDFCFAVNSWMRRSLRLSAADARISVASARRRQLTVKTGLPQPADYFDGYAPPLKVACLRVGLVVLQLHGIPRLRS